MRKKLLTLFTLITISLPFGVIGQAGASIGQPIVPQCSGGGGLSGQTNTVCPDVTGSKKGAKNDPIIKIIKDVTIVVSWVTGVIAVIMIIISAIKFITSGGDSAKVASARSTLITAMVGIAITITAQLIVVFVLDKING